MGADGPGAGDLLFGARLRAFRARARLSQEALAERAGLGLATLKALERDRRQHPRHDTLERLAVALGLGDTEHAALLELAGGVPTQPTGLGSPAPVAPRAAALVRLPVPPTPLIGRQAELARLKPLLEPTTAVTRLLTLVGPGGVGKTRLALAAAADLVDAYPDGVVFIDLAPLHDPRLVPASIAYALELRESSGQGARELLLEFLRERETLLVLDNFEHLLAATPLPADLLARCPRLALMVTSRVALRLRGEQRFDVPPLAAPAGEPSLKVIAASPAVRLFVERAQAVAPDFVLHGGNAAAVSAVCRRLDGMPLAIELAAARAGLLHPEALLRRLERRLPLLTGGAADLPERQQTLRNTLAWSHDLLGPAEQLLFGRLAVFAGGWTLEAAEAVCGDAALPSDEVIHRLQVLVDSSLVRGMNDTVGELRFNMLETVREYGVEQLQTTGEGEEVRARHAAYIFAIGERAEVHLTSPEQAVWLDRLDGELDNIRAALAWARSSGRLELGLRLASALVRFWEVRSHQREARSWLESLMQGLTQRGDLPSDVAALLASALGTTSWIAFVQGDYRAPGPWPSSAWRVGGSSARWETAR